MTDSARRLAVDATAQSRRRRVRSVRLGNANALQHGARALVQNDRDIKVEIALTFATHAGLDPIADRRLVEHLATTRIQRQRVLLAMARDGFTSTLTSYDAKLGPQEERLERTVRELERQRVADRAKGADPLRAIPTPEGRLVTHPIVELARDELEFTYTPGQAAIIEAIYEDGIRTAVLRMGRRSGKGRIAAGIAVYEATVNADAHLSHAAPGERLAIVVISSSQENARTVHDYIRGWLRRPAFAGFLESETEKELRLSNGIVIKTLPCHAATVRGLAVPVLILDEAAWYLGRDGSLIDPGEIYNAASPATAQFPERRILITSTPRWSVGWFADMCERAGSGRFADMRHWHAKTAEINPAGMTFDIEEERAKDEALFRREYEAEFDSGIGAMFDADAVRLAVRDGGDLPPRPGIRYLISVDQAFVGDTFAVTVGHRGELDAGDLIVVDRVSGRKGSRKAPLLVDQALDEVADLARAYNGAAVVLDQHAAQPLIQALEHRRVNVRERPWTAESKLAAATSVRRVLNGARLSLPAHAALVAELITLEQRPLPSGRIRIAAPGGGHDDYAMALLALVDELEAGTRAATSRSWAFPNGLVGEQPVVRRGDLVLVGSKFVDKKPIDLAGYYVGPQQEIAHVR